ncbi:amino acid adenylation domain-containing protein, partial [Ascidiimonas sp. W6]|uniref:amino acid adenylation domain-containing protein n=1 Tax=Ascidiimonas meishanensis TaxID=3128903 RepID=UPI0030ECD32E
EHQHAPFEKIVERVVDTRDMSTSALFQVMFVLQNTPEDLSKVKERPLGGLEIAQYEFAQTTAKYDLTLNAVEGDNGIAFNMEYCTDLFHKATIERMLSHYQNLLVSIVNNMTLPITQLAFLPEQEKHLLLDVFNDTKVDYPKDKTIVDLFQEQVNKTPDNIALVFEEKTLNYLELDKRSNQLANYLIAQGVKKDDLVAISLERSLEMIIGILGILKAGAAYVPIDPGYPELRIKYMIQDAGVDLVVTSKTSYQALETIKGIKTLVLDGIHLKTIKKESIDSFGTIATPQTLAYVIYTSGSTGKPKGVMVEHQSIINLCKNCDYVSLNSDTIWLPTGSISFDATTLEYWGTLLNGGQLILASNYTILDKNILKKLLVDKKVNTLWMTASWFHQIAEYDLSFFESLQHLLVGGDTVNSKHTNNLKVLNPELSIINGYGPTEGTTFSTIYSIGQTMGNNIPIGSPISNTQIYILSEQQELVPIGVVGELCISGAGVARGYLNKEELTKQKFVENPFVPGERMYRTGDLARWMPDGNIQFIGRKDHQIKIRGYRIELGEIETALAKIREVAACCVLAKEDVSGNKRLVAYMVLEEETLDKQAIQDSLKQSLPEYMVPTIWVELETMPLTTNGKLDKKALPDPDASLLSSQSYVAPRNLTEQTLVTIWQKLLGVEQIGVHDNFFELGGHSLLVAQLISRLQEKGFHLRVKDIFESPIISDLSLKLAPLSDTYRVPDNGITIDSDTITPSMVPLLDFSQEDLDKIIASVPGGISNIEDIYPLSPLQQGIHFHHMMSSPVEGDPYILPSLLSFSELTKRTAFIQALEFVISRHDVLRTCIFSEGLPHAVQVVLKDTPLSIEPLEFSDTQDILAELKVLTAPGKQWMDLSKAPLLNIKTAEDLESDNYYLILNQHHLILDHVGLEKLIGEITLCLSENSAQLNTPVLYRNFIGYALYQQATNNSEAYFKERYQEIEISSYPFDLSNIFGDGTQIKEAKCIVSSNLSARIRAVSSTLKVSPAVLFHAAYGIVVGRCSNTNYAIFGSLFSGRLQGSLGADQSLGLFINTLPVLVELSGNVAEYIQKVKSQLQELVPYEQTPLASIQRWSGIPNNLPLFSALLNYRHSSPISSENINTEFDLGITLLAGQERTNYPFNLNVDDLGSDFELTAQVDGSLDPEQILCYMVQALEQLLEAMDKKVSLNMTGLSILPQKEKTLLLHDFNDTKVDYPKDKTIVDLFQEQVNKTPDNIALVFEEKTLSYLELDKRS